MVANTLLLITAAIWGLGFVAQVLGMNYLEPFAFIGIRFLLGAASLLPLVVFFHHRKWLPVSPAHTVVKGSLVLGVILFAAGSLQQVGIVYSNASNAGFITGLYMVIVPIIGLALKYRTGLNTWLGCVLAVVGLFLLSVKADFTMGYGDTLLLVGAVGWALHILAIDHYAPRAAPLLLSLGQFIVCGCLAMVVSVFIETTSWEQVRAATYVLIYAGVITVGVAYTLQVIAQERADPTHAAIILSLEAVFGALGGYMFLQEQLSGRELIGCVLMLMGMLVSQVTWSDFVGLFRTKAST
ncbi:MAG: DMT family transporter [Pseudomonadota bacterium]|nr:DMT family transporter [Pseudomonadota bacterium]MEC7251479.1 DMT family transporter [Pseudomonadota bacterium]MEC7780737.1 DMT family transporter [Pseudomonadota bacterium]MEC7957850.1 DMT family transporter [Pseudomonadota bacterium]MEC7976303.1 DMT family transporter [Pseudomonadota bacterium]